MDSVHHLSIGKCKNKSVRARRQIQDEFVTTNEPSSTELMVTMTKHDMPEMARGNLDRSQGIILHKYYLA
jgi:hypothetical protein